MDRISKDLTTLLFYTFGLLDSTVFCALLHAFYGQLMTMRLLSVLPQNAKAYPQGCTIIQLLY